MTRKPTTESSSGVVLRTLTDFKGYTIRAHCRSCSHDQVLELAAVAERTGWDFPITRLKNHLRCSECKARDCGVIISHSGHPATASH